MADSASESDSSSIDGGPIMMPPSPITREQLQKRIESLQQQNRVLKVELETYKLRVKALQEENRDLKKASVIIQAKAEQEEEFISNTLLKKIQVLKKEKETLAHHYEREEECLTNDLSRKLTQLRQEKCRLEQTLEQEQECLVNRLMRKIEKLEAETLAKQSNLEQLRREKVELENTLEQEQEALVNKLWKRMDKLEAEKRMLQIKLDQPVSDPASPREINNGDTATNLSSHIQTLRSEVTRLRSTLAMSQQEHTQKMQRFAQEERNIKEENLRLQRKLQLEVERREALCRHLSESESSLEMEEERHYNEQVLGVRQHTVSPVPVAYNPSPSQSRPLSPGMNSMQSPRDSLVVGPPRCHSCGQLINHPGCISSALHHPANSGSPPAPHRRPSERFIKPAIPAAPQPASPMDTSVNKD
ncbi:coiled-coil domain-containing protein 6 [Diorhabda carinulata]|uniref:coiled-coil domain-containing protein 6 n=1 Tax=Diorhabda sublineata TaxID=1163346 RepID=UPI0024E0DBCE|nr:coiled-coil domain-containing protein 6 [Diorhabda sublineata]XP_057651272.1 coiled-coil domain-containing protein 6 [Diorhabda carinulata]XP_057651274.1 coiled-coil domain-containing protein 6 [Diorhabda carinulata]